MNSAEVLEESGERQPASRLVRWLRWALLFVFLAGLGWYIKGHSSDFAVIKSVNLETLLLVIGLQICSLCIFSSQFYLVARAFDINVPFFHWLRMVISSRFLNRIFPQAGNVFRVAELKLTYNVPVRRYFTSLATFGAINRLLGLTLVFGLLSLYRPDLQIAGFTARWPLLIILLLSSAVILVLRRLPDSLAKGSYRGAGFLLRLVQLTRRVAGIASNVRLLAGLMAFECLIMLVSVACHLLVSHELGVDLHFSEAALLIIIKRLVNVTSLTPGNVGLLETLYGLVLGDMKSAGAAGILVGAIINLTAFIASGFATLLLAVIAAVREYQK